MEDVCYLQPLAEDEGDEMADVHRLGRGTPARVQVEWLAFFLTIKDRVEISGEGGGGGFREEEELERGG